MRTTTDAARDSAMRDLARLAAASYGQPATIRDMLSEVPALVAITLFLGTIFVWAGIWTGAM